MQFIFIESIRLFLFSFQKDRSKSAWVEAPWSSKANTCSLSFHVFSSSLGVICSSGSFVDFAPFSRRAQGWVIIECDHLLNDRVILTSQLGRISILVWIIPALLDDPVLLTRLHVALKWAVVVADHASEWIIEAITDIVRSRWDQSRTLDVVNDESFSVGANTLEHLSVEATVALRWVRPFLVLKRQIVIEEVVTGNKFSSVPFSDISTL